MYLATNLQFIFCAFLLTFQDCVQLNQYTLKDEIGKVTIPGDRLVFRTYQGCLEYCGSTWLELGVSEESLENRLGGGVFCFILFCFYIRLCVSTKAHKASRVILYHQQWCWYFFLLKVFSYLFCFYPSVLLYFVLFLHQTVCFYKSSQSFQSNSVSPTLVLVFFPS